MEYEDMSPNPFGGEPFLCLARFELKEVNKKLGVVKISWSQKVNPEDAQRIMDKPLKHITGQMGKPVPKSEALKLLPLEDSADFSFDLNTGWIQTVSHKRITKSEGNSQEDSVTSTRKDN